jgi:inner membrane protein
MQYTLWIKGLALAAVMAVLLGALSRVEGLVGERQARGFEARRSIEASLAGEQTVLGPLVHSSCAEEWETSEYDAKERKVVVPHRREFMLSAMPTTLRITGNAQLEPRYRGLYKLNTFAMKAAVHAQWNSLEALRPERTQVASRMSCGAPLLMVAVSDARGVRLAQASVRSGDAPAAGAEVRSATLHGVHRHGFHVRLPDAAVAAGQPLHADLTIELVGSGRLAFVPLGDSSVVELASDWPHPSFGGRFLPATRVVSENGFTATWRLSALATSAPQHLRVGGALCEAHVSAPPAANKSAGCVESFDVSFIDPVNPYTLSDRAVKYGLLFIVLAFVGVGLFELMQRARVHPVQYLLVGLAMVVFFLLLLSLSEHMPFGAAYAVAAAACVVLLGYYASHVLHGVRRGLPFAAGIAALYALLYVLLQLEQTALVLGAVLLFAVLALVMALTRRVDWYALLEQVRVPASRETAPQASAPQASGPG